MEIDWQDINRTKRGTSFCTYIWQVCDKSEDKKLRHFWKESVKTERIHRSRQLDHGMIIRVKCTIHLLWAYSHPKNLQKEFIVWNKIISSFCWHRKNLEFMRWSYISLEVREGNLALMEYWLWKTAVCKGLLDWIRKICFRIASFFVLTDDVGCYLLIPSRQHLACHWEKVASLKQL